MIDSEVFEINVEIYPSLYNHLRERQKRQKGRKKREKGKRKSESERLREKRQTHIETEKTRTKRSLFLVLLFNLTGLGLQSCLACVLALERRIVLTT